ncbi:MAG: hypothetical protein PHQ59_00795 [Candidatus Daviesbacteria bacterium]|nr:hypothetical protein [Candidatus Daviesbacteria bacterium]
MAALNQKLIEDTIHLVETYQKSTEDSAFRRRFNSAIARDVNATYKNRPLKLYFEVLASINNPKYGESYKNIQRLVKHDDEGIISKALLRVDQNDLKHLYAAAKDNTNSTKYPDKEIKDINNIEETIKDPNQKREAHKKRLEETSYLAVEKKTPTSSEIEKPEEKTGPGSSPEYKKSYNPATQEEKVRLEAAFNQTRPEVSQNVLVGPSGEPIRNIYSEEPPQEIFEPTSSEPDSSSLPQIPDFGGISRTTNFAKNIFKGGEAVETLGAEAGVRMAAGKAAVAGAEKVIAKAGAGTATRIGAGLLARAGFTAAAGAAATGVGVPVAIIITLVTAFGSQIKKLGKLLLQVTVAITCAFILMFFWNWGEKMNSLLPPYTVGEAAELPTVTPTTTPSPTGPNPTPAPGVTANCPISGGNISCGSQNTNYYACPGGHCSLAYRRSTPINETNCNRYPATAYGMDILASAGQVVSIPTIRDTDGTVRNLECSFVYQDASGEAINQFNCIAVGSTISPPDHYYIQFHHLRAVIPSGPYRTGSPAGYVLNDHTHVQIGRNGVCQGTSISSCIVPEETLQCY